MHTTPIQIRFNDVDQMGHVNNAVIMEYLDLGKDAFFSSHGLSPTKSDFTVMVVHYDVDFRAQIHYHDKIQVETSIERFGTKSLTVLQRVVNSENGTVCVECRTVMAGYRRSTSSSEVIPDEVKQWLSRKLKLMKKALVFCIVMCGLFGAAAQNADMNATGLICIEEYGPQFPGGDDSLYSFIQRNIQYPERCHEATGKVYVAFTVETDGSITDAKVLRGICSEYNEEALRIVRMMPRFIPGRYSDGTPVRVTMCLPIVFDFQSGRRIFNSPTRIVPSP